jgi:predicted ester cyclase
MTPEDLKERNRRFVDEAWVQGDLSVVDVLVSPDIVHHVAGQHPGPGTEGIKDFIQQIRSVFSDMHVTYENEIVEGDKAVRHITVHGTHTGGFLGIPPTGKNVAFEVIDINRFDGDGKIVEHWSITDLFSLLGQIDALPRPESA